MILLVFLCSMAPLVASFELTTELKTSKRYLINVANIMYQSQRAYLSSCVCRLYNRYFSKDKGAVKNEKCLLFTLVRAMTPPFQECQPYTRFINHRNSKEWEFQKVKCSQKEALKFPVQITLSQDESDFVGECFQHLYSGSEVIIYWGMRQGWILDARGVWFRKIPERSRAVSGYNHLLYFQELYKFFQYMKNEYATIFRKDSRFMALISVLDKSDVTTATNPIFNLYYPDKPYKALTDCLLLAALHLSPPYEKGSLSAKGSTWYYSEVCLAPPIIIDASDPKHEILTAINAVEGLSAKDVTRAYLVFKKQLRARYTQEFNVGLKIRQLLLYEEKLLGVEAGICADNVPKAPPIDPSKLGAKHPRDRITTYVHNIFSGYKGMSKTADIGVLYIVWSQVTGNRGALCKLPDFKTPMLHIGRWFAKLFDQEYAHSAQTERVAYMIDALIKGISAQGEHALTQCLEGGSGINPIFTNQQEALFYTIASFLHIVPDYVTLPGFKVDYDAHHHQIVCTVVNKMSVTSTIQVRNLPNELQLFVQDVQKFDKGKSALLYVLSLNKIIAMRAKPVAVYPEWTTIALSHYCQTLLAQASEDLDDAKL